MSEANFVLLNLIYSGVKTKVSESLRIKEEGISEIQFIIKPKANSVIFTATIPEGQKSAEMPKESENAGFLDFVKKKIIKETTIKEEEINFISLKFIYDSEGNGTGMPLEIFFTRNGEKQFIELNGIL